MQGNKNNRTLLFVVVLAHSLIMPLGYAASLDGSACTKINQVVTSQATTFKCSLVWKPTPSKLESTKFSNLAKSLQDKGFRLNSVKFNNSAGFAMADARITNITKKTLSATLSITILAEDHSTILVNLLGSVMKVKPGQTVTASFVGNGNLPAKTSNYRFQVSLQF